MQIKTHTSKSCIKLSGKIHVMFYSLSEKKSQWYISKSFVQVKEMEEKMPFKSNNH